MSRAAQIRAWLIAAGGMHSAKDVSDGLGAEGKERLLIAWTLALLVRSGQVKRDGLGRGTRYEFVRPPTKASKLTPEVRRAKRNAASRERWKRLGGRSQDERLADLRQQREARQAARAEQQAAREARATGRPPKKRAAAQRQERPSAPRPAPTRLQRVGSMAGMTPKPVVTPSSRPAETVEQFLARGGAVDRLPGIQAAPAPRTIPTWRNAA
ncbi:hypothetical protein [Xanthomonas translucens]|uniref:hypothetical protein n=1 Tax=Xanthomonas campestris pv. translucens TaxID=343 RepID=UPI00071E887A|nr:hypothetical protein [Xanthomonas translucens]QEN93627.1 hypothetical protein F0H33_09775 [Xanthomonas translucens pv. undulosa]QSQ58058.1 hypothetical protein ISN37_09045 [Xanthomonas translucens pv. undulosa]